MPMPWPETAITGPVEVHEHRLATIEVQDHIIIGTEHRLPLEATEAIMAVMRPEAITEVPEHGLQEATRLAEATIVLRAVRAPEAIVAVDTLEAVGLAEATVALEAALEVPALADHQEVHVPLEEPHVLLAVVEADAVAEDHNHSINLSINLNHKK